LEAPTTILVRVVNNTVAIPIVTHPNIVVVVHCTTTTTTTFHRRPSSNNNNNNIPLLFVDPVSSVATDRNTR
jgi:hypothetical protein